MEDVERVRAGVPADEISEVAKAIGVSIAALAEATGLPLRTAQRRKSRASLLNREQSEKVLRVRRVLAMAEEVIGKEQAADWMKQPAFALGDVTPLSLLDTSAGEQLVTNLLHGIEYGVYQ